MADRIDHLSTSGADQPSHTGGLLSALILGSLTMVVAMIALTIAIGRAPVQAAAGERQAAPAATAEAPTSYPSPEPTGPRYTPEPIVMDAPQKPPYHEPTPSASPSTGSSEAESADGEDADTGDPERSAQQSADRLAGLEERIEQRIRDRIGHLDELEDD